MKEEWPPEWDSSQVGYATHWKKVRETSPDWMREMSERLFGCLFNNHLFSEKEVRRRIESGELTASRGPRGYGKLTHSELLAILGLAPNAEKEICQCCGQVIRRKNAKDA